MSASLQAAYSLLSYMNCVTLLYSLYSIAFVDVRAWQTAVLYWRISDDDREQIIETAKRECQPHLVCHLC